MSTTLMVAHFVVGLPLTSRVSASASVVALENIAGETGLLLGLVLIGVSSWVVLISCCSLDSHLNERLVLQLLVNVCEQLLVLVTGFAIINFITDLIGLLLFLLGDDDLVLFL